MSTRPIRQLKQWRTPVLDPDDPRLFQEQLLNYNADKDALAWYMACACTIMSKSNRVAAFPVMTRFFTCFTPLSCAIAPDCRPVYDDLLEILRPSGMFNIKATRIISLSSDWSDHRGYQQLAGASKYFQQSYEIFVLEKYPHLEDITDHHLKAYVCAHATGSSLSPV